MLIQENEDLKRSTWKLALEGGVAEMSVFSAVRGQPGGYMRHVMRNNLLMDLEWKKQLPLDPLERDSNLRHIVSEW